MKASHENWVLEQRVDYTETAAPWSNSIADAHVGSEYVVQERTCSRSQHGSTRRRIYSNLQHFNTPGGKGLIKRCEINFILMSLLVALVGEGKGPGCGFKFAGSSSRVPVRVRRSKPYGNSGAKLYDYDAFIRPPKYKYLCKANHE